MSRFEPENNPHRVVEAYRRVPGDLPLVMVGGAPYASEFIRQFTADADPRVRFPGSIYGRGYRELQTHALAYVHATEVGGTHPALVEAMGYGNCVLVNDAPENLEVAGEAGLYFSAAEPETLTELMTTIAGNKALSDKHSRQAAQRAAELYSWPSVTASYESLIQHLARD